MTWRRIIGFVSVAALVLVGTPAFFVGADPDESGPWPTAAARRDHFVDSLIEPGTITAARMRLYASTITGAPSKIVELAREGTFVRPGDVLVRFDSAGFEHDLRRELASLAEAEAILLKVKEEERLDALDAQAALESAHRQVAWAETALADRQDGTGRVEVAEAESAASEAARRLERAETQYKDLQPMLAEGFITRAELERAHQQVQEAIESKRLADLRREALLKFGRPAAIDKARADIVAARDALARQQDSQSAHRAQLRAATMQAAARVEEVRARVAMLQDRLARSAIVADGAGLVVHKELFFGGDRRKPQVGDEAWPNQPLLAVPDPTSLAVETRVREVDLHKLTSGQRVIVAVEAYPDLRLPAQVDMVGALAEADATRAGVKWFPVGVRLLQSDERLRTGMTGRVEIEVATIAHAIVVPSTAIFRRDGASFCYVMRHGRPVRTPVVVAGDNGLEAAVSSGVSEHDVVLLVDPAQS